MSELIFILLFFGIPGLFGFIMARKRGKNPYLWGLFSAVFPFFLVVLKMQYKPQDKNRPPA
jgi:TM2 domain-containing membrane protein YozV